MTRNSHSFNSGSMMILETKTTLSPKPNRSVRSAKLLAALNSYAILLAWLLVFSNAMDAFAVENNSAEDNVGQESVVEKKLGYNDDIRPILAENCFACHGQDPESREAGLRLDVRSEAIDFAAIIPKDASSSEIVARIHSTDPDSVMPPPHSGEPLSDEQKQKLEQWINEGADYEEHWAFSAPDRPELPQVVNGDWVKNPIDNFVLAKLESENFAPSPAADLNTLFRRIHLDITGLPPSPEVVERFLADVSSSGEMAISQWIDRLMETPEWGEHRARYWLDAARYGDTHGMHFDNYREIFPYRDWVVRAFNENKPFDEFTVEQLAGDLLPNPTEEQLVATGFQRCNITTNEGGTIDEENVALYASDRVQTYGWVYLGLTTNCCQCHDHKFDPLTAKDYYSLAAFFRNTTEKPKDGNVKDGRGPVIVVPSMEDQPRWDALPEEISMAKNVAEQRKVSAQDDYAAWLSAVSSAALDQQVPTEGLELLAALNEGQGNAIRNARPRELNEIGSDDASGDKPETFEAAGKVKWKKDGKLGSAPEMSAQTTFQLPQHGDFAADEAFSYGAWVKSPGDNFSAGVIARMDEASDYRGWDLWQEGKNYAVHIIDKWPGNALKVVTQSPVVVPGKWQHVFVTYNGNRKSHGVKIYVNGKEQPIKPTHDSLAADSSIHATVPFRIGGRSGGQIFNQGLLQDVRLYRRELSPGDVNTLANIAPLKTMLETPADQRTAAQKESLFEHYLNTVDAEYARLAEAVRNLESEFAVIKARSPVTHVQQEKANSMAMANILKRGEYDSVGEQVIAAPPAALHPMPENAPANRLGLAMWTIDSANPLTARVTVNRFWQQVFGQGIVVTPEDFGVMGAKPSHPELLDWLAVEFRESGWDVKHMFKLMLNSAAYQQAAIATPDKLERDRDNNLLTRGPRFRMDAEMLRDYALESSGLLSDKMFGPGVKPYQPIGIWDVVGLPGGDTRNYVQSSGEDLYRRTLYTFWKRMAPPPNLETLNAPSREYCVVQRERTNTPLQALVTLNDPQFVEAARVLAQSELSRNQGDRQSVLDSLGMRTLCRPLTDQEKTVLFSDLDVFLEYYEANPDDAGQFIAIGEFPLNEEIAPTELAAWTLVCNQLLNLDEVLCK